jgi:hypothetical protein
MVEWYYIRVSVSVRLRSVYLVENGPGFTPDCRSMDSKVGMSVVKRETFSVSAGSCNLVDKHQIVLTLPSGDRTLVYKFRLVPGGRMQ